MTTIKAVNDGFLLDNKLLLGASEGNNKYINLATTIGEDMRYQKLDYALVDYPGEYDIEETTIQCFLGKNNLLNYLISYNNKRIAVLQSPDVLENTTDFAVAQEWIYTDDSVLAKLEQLEVEGEKIKLGGEIIPAPSA
ncbi:TPA: hypothetical protein DIC40_08355 [Patescibacteria group bacterium]|nr:hypothetical protein P148_SR1C00001G0168 [candidate division SR1 bacterium RAAC1_SR1_1]HCY21793.1 hypothetical protein [Candidatus Gracilibacteria bacterium]